MTGRIRGGVGWLRPTFTSPPPRTPPHPTLRKNQDFCSPDGSLRSLSGCLSILVFGSSRQDRYRLTCSCEREVRYFLLSRRGNTCFCADLCQCIDENLLSYRYWLIAINRSASWPLRGSWFMWMHGFGHWCSLMSIDVCLCGLVASRAHRGSGMPYKAQI